MEHSSPCSRMPLRRGDPMGFHLQKAFMIPGWNMTLVALASWLTFKVSMSRRISAPPSTYRAGRGTLGDLSENISV